MRTIITFLLSISFILSFSQNIDRTKNVIYSSDTVITVNSQKEMKREQLLTDETQKAYVLVEGKEWVDSKQEYEEVSLTMILSAQSYMLVNSNDHYSFVTNLQSAVGFKNGYYKLYIKETESKVMYAYSFKVVKNKFVMDF